MTTHDPQQTLVIIRGKGTAHEQHIATDIPVYWSDVHQRWMTIPVKDDA